MPRRKKSDEGIMDITRMAEDLGVSKTTVSRALSGNGRVSEATRQRVVDYAREKNYVPNMMAKSLVTKKSYNVALVFSRQFSNFEGQFLRKTITAVCDVMARWFPVATARSTCLVRRWSPAAAWLPAHWLPWPVPTSRSC